MVSFADDYDIIGLHEKGCWFEREGEHYYKILLEMDKYPEILTKTLMRAERRVQDEDFLTIWKLDMIFKISCAVKKFHDNSLVHFDLKDSNIFMMNDYTPVVADLGFANFRNNEYNKKFVVGTPLFLGEKVESFRN